MIINGVQLDLVCEDSWKVSFISSSLMIGYLLASVFSGILSDRFVKYHEFVVLLSLLFVFRPIIVIITIIISFSIFIIIGTSKNK